MPQQQQVVDQRALEEAQNDFSSRFKAWLESLGEAQAHSGADAPTDAVVERVGGVPQPQATETLNRTQIIFLRSYARSYGVRLVENRKMQAVVATARPDSSNPERSRQLQAAADFWQAVELWVDQSLR
ncbi:hypothetical protein GCM10023107_90160 [Actinoplanes octamycinicus]|nr:hypothetical protein Aoc01nite_65570 [Actinoplanes octamycinicus]